MSAVLEQVEILVDEWVGCYRGGWKGVICDEAFSHPAKVAFNLARRIYEHAIEEKWIVSGDTIVDPFGGIGGCAFHGLMNGMIVVTNELEEKFVNLSKQNRELWRKQYTGLKGFDADNWIILQGDSRRLSAVIREAGLSVSSPPYVAPCGHGGQPTEIDIKKGIGGDLYKYADHSEGQLAAMREGDLTLAVSSPPYASGEKGHPSLGSVNKDDWGNDGRDITRRRGLTGEYGAASGNVANMPEGDHALCVSSPPFPQPYTGGGGINVEGYRNDKLRPGSEEKPFDLVGKRTYQSQGGDRAEGNLETLETGSVEMAITSPPYNPPMSQDHNGSRGGKRGTEPSETGAFVKYGTSEGQIEGLSMDGFEVAISSPPYEGSIPQDKRGAADLKIARQCAEKYGRKYTDKSFRPTDYGDSDGQVGAMETDTFWSASRTILEQLYSVLTPGAHAIFIVKAFVRNKQIVDFPGQWAQLCEAVGFKLIHDHHAMLSEDYGTQGGMFGEDKQHKVKRVSFFRRLHEKRSPETAIECENVLCFERL